MNRQIANALLLCSAVGLSYIVLLVGWVTPDAFRSIYSLKTLQEARVLMPDVTMVVVDHSWAFALAIVLLGLVSKVFTDRNPDKMIPFMALGLCCQWLVAWVALLAFFFKGVTGPMSLHHDSEFEFVEFMSFGMGIFPVTLIAVLAPMFVAIKLTFKKD